MGEAKGTPARMSNPMKNDWQQTAGMAELI